MIRVGIVGATGYTAVELIKLLLRHPHVQITRLTSRSDTGQPIEQTHPSLRDRLNLALTEFELEDFVAHVDCGFCCLPHAASSPIVKQIVDRGVRVIDFSADYRLSSLEQFTRIYQVEHADAGRLGHVPYGLPELFADEIRTAELVANPGCFPTTAILALSPLIVAGAIARDDIIVDSKTGVSGGGRTPKLNFHFPECNESVTAYGLGTHRHGPEIGEILSRWTKQPVQVTFAPHLIPMDRGILSTIYVRPVGGWDAKRMQQQLAEFYADSVFVRISSALPTTKDVSFTNFCDITTRDMGSRVAIVSVIDNLIKGASGAAVQNMNVMYGWEQTLGVL